MSSGNLNAIRYREWTEGDKEVLGPLERYQAYNYALAIGDQETANEISMADDEEEA